MFKIVPLKVNLNIPGTETMRNYIERFPTQNNKAVFCKLKSM